MEWQHALPALIVSFTALAASMYAFLLLRIFSPASVSGSVALGIGVFTLLSGAAAELLDALGQPEPGIVVHILGYTFLIAAIMASLAYGREAYGFDYPSPQRLYAMLALVGVAYAALVLGLGGGVVAARLGAEEAWYEAAMFTLEFITLGLLAPLVAARVPSGVVQRGYSLIALGVLVHIVSEIASAASKVLAAAPLGLAGYALNTAAFALILAAVASTRRGLEELMGRA